MPWNDQQGGVLESVSSYMSSNGEGACGAPPSSSSAHQSQLELTLTRKTVQHCQSRECNQQEIFSKRSQMTGELLKKKSKTKKPRIRWQPVWSSQQTDATAFFLWWFEVSWNVLSVETKQTWICKSSKPSLTALPPWPFGFDKSTVRVVSFQVPVSYSDSFLWRPPRNRKHDLHRFPKRLYSHLQTLPRLHQSKEPRFQACRPSSSPEPRCPRAAVLCPTCWTGSAHPRRLGSHQNGLQQCPLLRDRTESQFICPGNNF